MLTVPAWRVAFSLVQTVIMVAHNSHIGRERPQRAAKKPNVLNHLRSGGLIALAVAWEKRPPSELRGPKDWIYATE
jgi:hypothetical protein